MPVVGDFDGDGIDEIGVFRDGKWIIDTNHNRELDAQDKVFELGGAGDQPVVGDWNDDGTDDPGVYQPGAATDRVAPRRLIDWGAATSRSAISSSPFGSLPSAGRVGEGGLKVAASNSSTARSIVSTTAWMFSSSS